MLWYIIHHLYELDICILIIDLFKLEMSGRIHDTYKKFKTKIECFHVCQNEMIKIL